MKIEEADIERMKECLSEIKDERRQSGNFHHKLMDILVIGLCSVLDDHCGFEEMEELGGAQEAFFKKFLDLSNGIPDEYTFKRVFQMINPQELQKALNEWLELGGEAGGRTVNIDGKSIRGSADGNRSAVHIVSAWVNDGNLVLGQVKTEEKSNEITAIPQLLDAIEISGDTVTIDAMGCQTAIAAKIRDKGANYVLAVKENQKTLYTEIKEYFEYLDDKQTGDLPLDIWDSGNEKGHGRTERRVIRTACEIDFLSGKDNWKDLKTIIQCRSTRIIGNKTTVSDRYYISSADADADWFCKVIRGHWSIENNLHWMLDVCFREDYSRARCGNLAENLNILRKVALSRIKAQVIMKGKKKLSVRCKMFRASLNVDFLYQILFGKS